MDFFDDVGQSVNPYIILIAAGLSLICIFFYMLEKRNEDKDNICLTMSKRIKTLEDAIVEIHKNKKPPVKMSVILKHLDDHDTKVRQVEDITNSLSDRFNKVEKYMKKEIGEFRVTASNRLDKLEQYIAEKSGENFRTTVSERLRAVEGYIADIAEIQDVVVALSGKIDNVSYHVKEVQKIREVTENLSDRLKKIEKHTENSEEFRALTDSLSERVKNMEFSIKKVKKLTQSTESISEKMSNMEGNFDKLQEHVERFFAVCFKRKEMERQIKIIENTLARDVIAESIDLMGSSIQLVRNRNQLCAAKSLGAPMLEIPFQPLQLESH
jgi:methyl-accepting chemotaxis protein